MKKKALKKRIKQLEKGMKILGTRMTKAEMEIDKCRRCENYEPKTVEFRRWIPIDEIAQFNIYKDETDE